jgi:hypothetical protein
LRHDLFFCLGSWYFMNIAPFKLDSAQVARS